MIAIMRSEWLKLRTTAVPWVLAGIALLVNALLILVIFLTRPDNAPPGGGYTIPHTTQQLRNLVGSGFQGYLLALLLGTLIVTTEFRHKTVTTSCLVTPVRSVLVAGKLLTAAVATGSETSWWALISSRSSSAADSGLIFRLAILRMSPTSVSIRLYTPGRKRARRSILARRSSGNS